MNGARFDSMVRALATEVSRRRILQAGLGTLGVGILRERHATAAAQSECGAFEDDCFGYYTDTSSDPSNCGSCGRACPYGTTCRFGSCECSPFETLCSGACTNTTSDPNNCGSCGVVCPYGTRCSLGECECSPFETWCSDRCVNTSSDPDHCGACGAVCPYGTRCSISQCECSPFETWCDGQCVNTNTDASNCGDCRNACPYGTRCSVGSCVCPPTEEWCTDRCTDTARDPQHCGRCGNTCPVGSSCVLGVCQANVATEPSRLGPTEVAASRRVDAREAIYDVIDLGTGTGDWSRAIAINQDGVVVGLSAKALRPEDNVVESDTEQVFMWADGRRTDLTALGINEAFDINASGDILGTGTNGAVLLRGDTGQMEPLEFPATSSPLPAVALNDKREVVGGGGNGAFITGGRQIRPLVVPSGFSTIFPEDINNASQVVGGLYVTQGTTEGARAFIYRSGVVFPISAAPAGETSWALGVNDRGQVVGGAAFYRSIGGAGRAFLFDSDTGEMTDLGTLAGYEWSLAKGVNANGQVVGFAWKPKSNQPPFTRAFLYDWRDHSMVDLNDVIAPDGGWFLTDAVGINDDGQIIGQGKIADQVHAFLLTPKA